MFIYFLKYKKVFPTFFIISYFEKKYIRLFLKKILLGFTVCLSFMISISPTNRLLAKEMNTVESNEKREIPKLDVRASGNSGYQGGGSYFKYFSNSQWVYRNGYGWTFSITPTNYLRWNFSSNVAESAFLALMDVHKKDKQWKNTYSMREQFKCHFWNAKVKPTRNIEPQKTSNNPFNCN